MSLAEFVSLAGPVLLRYEPAARGLLCSSPS
jgi:hypothetical protein